MWADLQYLIFIVAVFPSTNGRKVVVLDDNEWDSVVVTSPPVKITDSRFNPKNSTKDHAIRFDKNRIGRRSLKECDDDDLKCKYDKELEESHNRNHQETINKFLEQYASVTNVKFNNDFRNGTTKAYWNQINAEKHNHPFDDVKGWVTLEPVPWSASKVSKWKPHKEVENTPWPQSPSPSTQYWFNNNHKPQEPSLPAAHWGIGSNDIVTDNRPNGFPLNEQNYRPTFTPSNQQPPPYIPPSYQPPEPQYQPQVFVPKPTHNYQPSSQHFSWQTGYTKHPAPNGFEGQQLSGYPTAHPNTYPADGNGEWVLLSTTKGYSLPQPYQDRKVQLKNFMGYLDRQHPDVISRSFKSRYAEKDLNDKFEIVSTSADVNRKSGKSFENGIESQIMNVDGINIIQTGKPLERAPKVADDLQDTPPQTTFKRTVRLTVLPPISNTSTTSHDGLLEVDANQQSVEEAQKEEERLKKLNNVAVVTSGRHPYQVIPIIHTARSQELDKKRAAVLAAIGAGMIPATMAVVLPVALGRKRRDVKPIAELKLQT